jgi:hypothetical protein
VSGKRSPAEQLLLSRQGGYLSNARMSPEQKKAQAARGLRLQISRMVDPDGTLERSNPREFERQYELVKKARMAELGARHSAKAAERRAQKEEALRAMYQPMCLLTGCPACNEAAGYIIPLGYHQELCVGHWLAEQQARVNALLDEAEARMARAS